MIFDLRFSLKSFLPMICDLALWFGLVICPSLLNSVC